jgi:hypothetical protein
VGRRDRDVWRHYQYVEAVVVDRVLDESTQSILRMLPGQPSVSPTRFSARVNWDDVTSEMTRFVERTFDGWLYFHNSGPREVAFRIPRSVLAAETVAPYEVGNSLKGVAAEVSGDDLIVWFRRYGEDDHLFNMHEVPSAWFGHILPVREELMSGRLDALELGPMIGTYANHLPGQPDLPAEYGLSKATRVLAAYLLVDPAKLAERTEPEITEETGPRTLPPDWRETDDGHTLVARWEFVAADPRKSFRISLGRLPLDSGWYVTSTEARGRNLAFETERDARRGYHDEALRLQRLNDPGRWHEDPD